MLSAYIKCILLPMREKYLNVSLYKIVASLMIVGFHFYFCFSSQDTQFELLLSKGMLGLTALSGFLHAEKKIHSSGRFFFDKLWRIIFPFLVGMGLIAIWNLIVYANDQSVSYASLFFGKRVCDGGLLFAFGNGFYVFYILGCYLLLIILKKINGKLELLFGFVVVAIECTVSFFFGYTLLLTAFLIGYFIGRKNFAIYVDPSKQSIPQLVTYGFIIIFFLYALNAIFCVPKINIKFINYTYRFLTEICLDGFGVSSLFFFLLAVKRVNKLNLNFCWKSFIFLGDLSYPIYIMDLAFMVGGSNITNFVDNRGLKILLTYVFTIGFAFIIFLIFKSFTLAKQRKRIKY